MLLPSIRKKSLSPAFAERGERHNTRKRRVITRPQRELSQQEFSQDFLFAGKGNRLQKKKREILVGWEEKGGKKGVLRRRPERTEGGEGGNSYHRKSTGGERARVSLAINEICVLKKKNLALASKEGGPWDKEGPGPLS